MQHERAQDGRHRQQEPEARGLVAGHELLIGSPAHVEQMTGSLTDTVVGIVRSYADEGLTPVLIACDGRHQVGEVATFLGVSPPAASQP